MHSIIRSDQFKFLVDEDQTPIMVHATAIAATCTQMNRLVNGAMKEGGERCAKIQDISVNDFIRFCEYAYRGDYAAPAYTIDEARLSSKDKEDSSKPSPIDQYGDNLEQAFTGIVDDTVQAEEASAMDDWSAFQSKKPKTPKPSKKSIFCTNYQSRNYLTSNEYKAEITHQFEPQCNTTDEQDFTPVFLAQARLYAFTRMRMVDNLKALTLQK